MLNDTIASAQKTTLEAVTSLQERIVAWNRDTAELFGSALSAVPVLPVMRDAFNPENFDQFFQFSSELLEANRKFTVDLLEVWAPKADAASS